MARSIDACSAAQAIGPERVQQQMGAMHVHQNRRLVERSAIEKEDARESPAGQLREHHVAVIGQAIVERQEDRRTRQGTAFTDRVCERVTVDDVGLFRKPVELSAEIRR